MQAMLGMKKLDIAELERATQSYMASEGMRGPLIRTFVRKDLGSVVFVCLREVG